MTEETGALLAAMSRKFGDFLIQHLDGDWAVYVPGRGQFYDCTLDSVLDMALRLPDPVVVAEADL